MKPRADEVPILAEIDAILKENARLLGEEQEVFVGVSESKRGRIRVGLASREHGAARYYPDVEAALAEAKRSNERAQRYVKTGLRW